MKMSGAEETPWIICEAEKLEYSNPENKWIKLYFDVVRFHDGRLGRYNKIIEGTTGRGVVIIPVNYERKIGMVRSYRYPIASWQWEFPRGFLEEGTTAEENAQRELAEEISMSAAHLVKIGEVFPNTGILSTLIEVFLAEGITPVKHLSNDKEAIMTIRFYTKEELQRMIVGGELRDGISLAALQITSSKGIL